jgi:hypothetical protein
MTTPMYVGLSWKYPQHRRCLGRLRPVRPANHSPEPTVVRRACRGMIARTSAAQDQKRKRLCQVRRKGGEPLRANKLSRKRLKRRSGPPRSTLTRRGNTRNGMGDRRSRPNPLSVGLSDCSGILTGRGEARKSSLAPALTSAPGFNSADTRR